MKIPDWYVLLLLALASFRIYRLLAEDTILDGPRARLLRLGSWQEGQPTPPTYRARLGEFIVCSWCIGFWVSLAVWGCWYVEPGWTTGLSAPLAISTLVGLVADRLT